MIELHFFYSAIAWSERSQLKHKYCWKIVKQKRLRRAEEPANFLAAPAPGFFSKRLRLLFFFQAAPAPRSQKHRAPTGSGSGSPALISIHLSISIYPSIYLFIAGLRNQTTSSSRGTPGPSRTPSGRRRTRERKNARRWKKENSKLIK